MKGLFLKANGILCRILGYPEEELLTKTFQDLTHPDDRDIAHASHETLLKTGKAQAEYRIVRPDGQIRWVLDRKTLSYDDQGRVIQMGGIGTDVTEIRERKAETKNLQAQLRQAQKMEAVGRLAGGVAHDFNNMLTVIKGYAELILADADPEGSFYHGLTEILEAANRSMDTTKKLLAFARKQTIAPLVLQLNKTVKKMLKLLGKLMGENIDLNFCPGEELWNIKIDPSQVDQILANLCVNARDAIGDVGKGTGLGLATVYGIVKQNNGFVNVYTEPEHGTTFHLYFPRHIGKEDTVQEETAAEILCGNGETIMVVEDEVSILNLMQEILEDLGYMVLTADTPGRAMDLAGDKSNNIHLLITDVVMPEMNGRDLAEILQSQLPDLKCLFMSGYTADVIAHHGILDKGVHFIQKPVSRNDLAAKVREILEI